MAVALFIMVPVSFLLILFIKSNSEGNQSGGFSQEYYDASYKRGDSARPRRRAACERARLQREPCADAPAHPLLASRAAATARAANREGCVRRAASLAARAAALPPLRGADSRPSPLAPCSQVSASLLWAAAPRRCVGAARAHLRGTIVLCHAHMLRSRGRCAVHAALH